MEAHEEVYQKLYKLGYEGWGGVSFQTRMNGWNKELLKVYELTSLKEGRVLELGCGAGDVSLSIASKGFEVSGIDISPTAVSWALEKAEKLGLQTSFISGSVSDNSIYEDEKFDLIIDGNCLHCLFDEDRIGFYNNLKRLTQENGFAFISSAVLNPNDNKNPKISSIDRCFVESETIEDDMKLVGFELIKKWFSEGTHLHYYGLFRKL